MPDSGNDAPPVANASSMGPINKRREQRRRVLYRASVVSIVRAGNVHLTGISPKTVTGISDFTLACHQRVVLDLGGAGHHFVTVSKCENGHFTGHFENPWAPLDPSLNWLANAGRSGIIDDQGPAQTLVAGLSLAGGHCVVAVRNLSDAGAMIEASVPFKPGQFMLFSLTYGEPALAEVRWVDNGRAGLKFHSPVKRGSVD